MGLFEKFKDLGEDDEYNIPSAAWVSLARRGMEQISLEQCFLPNCDNEDPQLIERVDQEEMEDDKRHIKVVTHKCKKCDGVFKLKFDTIKKVAKPTNKDEINEEDILSMGLVYALDKDDKNLGHIGYF